MTSPIMSHLEMEKRPKLLMRAAKFACSYYRREIDLSRILRCMPSKSQHDIVLRLIELEAEQDEKRRLNDAAYFVSDHIDCLAALISEAVLLLDIDKSAA